MSAAGQGRRPDPSSLVATGASTDQRAYLARCAGWRAGNPISWTEHPEFGALGAVLSYQLVDRIARDDRRFRHGPRSMLQPPAAELPASAPRSLIDSDGAEHRRLRALVAQPFQPAAVRRLREPIAALARQSIDRALRAGRPLDLVDELAMPYALQSLLVALGLPPGEAARINWLTTEPFSRQTAAKLGYLDWLLRQLAASTDRPPLAGLLSGDTGDTGDHPISRAQQIMLLLTVLTAGHETTAAAVTSGLRSLMDQPELLPRLLADQAVRSADPAAGTTDYSHLLDLVTEEILRTSSPITGLVRTVAVDTELAGLRLAAGQRLWLCFPAANHDPATFADPDRFDPARFGPDGLDQHDFGQRPPAATRQLAFGAGSHHCLGAGLARIEIAELLRALAEAGGSVRPAGASRFYQHHFLSRYTRLPALLQAGQPPSIRIRPAPSR